MDELLLFANTAAILYLILRDWGTNERIDALGRGLTTTKGKVDDIISHIYKDYFSKIKK